MRIWLAMELCNSEIKYISGKEGALADAVSRVNPQDEMEQMGLDFTIQEVTQCMTPIQMPMIHGKQKKDAQCSY